MIKFIYNYLSLEDLIAIHEHSGAEIVINNGEITEIVMKEKRRDGNLRSVVTVR